MTARGRLIQAFKETPGALKFAPDGEMWPLKAGGTSSWYIDCRPISYGDPGLVGSAVCDALHDALIGHGVTNESIIVFGPAFGAIPVAVATAVWKDVRSGTIRPQPKDHGASGDSLIVGPTAPGDNVILVEDVWTTGSTLEEAREAITHHYESAHWDWTLLATVVLVNRAKRGSRGHAMTKFWDAPFISVLRPTDIGAPDE